MLDPRVKPEDDVRYLRQVLIILSCLLFSIIATLPAHAQFEAKPTPIWEGVEKTEADKENDDKFIKQVLALTKGDELAAAQGVVQLGWEQIGQGKPNEAIRRFNQAWLINPNLPDIFWGFGVATHVRGDETDEVVRWFEEAFKGLRENPRFLADRGRVLEERKLPKRARFWFRAALDIDPDYVPAHVGMSRIANALGDAELEKTHLDRLKVLAPDLIKSDEETEKTE